MTSNSKTVGWLRSESDGKAIFEPDFISGASVPYQAAHVEYAPVVLQSDYEALQADLVDEREFSDQWRLLAMQFDRHRMQAVALLKLVAKGESVAADCEKFLSEQPLSGMKITVKMAELEAECGQLRKDANRYRWLRNQGFGFSCQEESRGITTFRWGEWAFNTREGFAYHADYAIDAAMQELQK